MTDQPRIVDLEVLAAAMNVSVRRVQQLVKEGMPKKAHGRYDLDECMRWYIRWLQKIVDARSPRTNTGLGDKHEQTFAEVRLRKEKADAALKELQLQKEKSVLIEIDLAAKFWADAVERMRSKLTASINQAAVKCVGLENIAQSHAILRVIVNDALMEVESIANDLEAAEFDKSAERTPETGSGIARGSAATPDDGF